ncbi:MAG: efflux RND transporter permease subunit [Planctomycetota bacterium]|nr:efflux RND transporter permease subunit [Planctomycetota bacterium]
MDFAAIAIKNKVVTLVLVVVMLGAGAVSYGSMSRLEDPEFTIKDALVITPYPGASPVEVEQEVSDRIETAAQQLGQVKRVVSRSMRGVSTVTVTVKDKYDKNGLPQVWDELRRKVGDVARELPPGAGTPMVIDDYGDVFGILAVVYGDGYSYAELKKVTDWLQEELMLVQDVAKISSYGERQECIYVELNRDRMAQLGISEQLVIQELRKKNVVTDTGSVQVGPELLALSPTGEFETIEQFKTLLVSGRSGQQVFLRDIADVRRDYVEPPTQLVRFDGKPGIALGISTIAGGNVVEMGIKLKQRMAELRSDLPLGIEFGVISVQSDSVVAAISNFLISLLEAVAIVIIVLLFFMGMRSGLLIGFVLLLTIVASFIFLKPMGVALERISLGALIIALGMLVDNAIVVVDGMLVRMQNGEKPEDAASSVVKQSAWPLLGATMVAILAFAAIGTSQDKTGEFCRSLYQVIQVSLLLSWVTAVTVTPLLCVMFLKVPKVAVGAEQKDPYDTSFYNRYRSFLSACIRKRLITVGVVVLAFLSGVFGFGMVEHSFFPPSTRPQFMVDVWMPQGTQIDRTTAVVAEVEEYLLQKNGVTHVSSCVGQGALRFLLTYGPEKANSAYAQLFIDVTDSAVIDSMMPEIENYLAERYPDALTYASKFMLGPGSTGKVQVRYSGPDPDVLRQLATQAKNIYQEDFDAKSIKTDWRQRVKVVRPQIIENTANLARIRRPDVSAAIRRGFEGERVGVYREDDLILPIILRAEEPQRSDIGSIRNLQIYNPVAQRMIPLRQVVSGFEVVNEDALVLRRNRKRTITVYCDPIHGAANQLFARVRPKLEAIELPTGYSREWGGEYEDSGDAQAALFGNIPTFVLLMVLITIALFNSLRLPLVIWLCVPLGVIGVTGGLLSTGQPFGFMALLGFLSLIGMLIKNAIVLIDEVNVQLAGGKSAMDSLLSAAVSRLRPVGMAASTTILGMMPLVIDAFFVSMAVTVIFGLLVATVLTMVVLPVFYSIVFKVKA